MAVRPNASMTFKKQSRTVSTTYPAVFWRTDCYPVYPRPKQCCSALEPCPARRVFNGRWFWCLTVLMVLLRDDIKLLGVTVDAALTMARCVTGVIRRCNCHVPDSCTSKHPSLLTLDAAKNIANGIVAARLNYCNSLLPCASTNNLNRLQVAHRTRYSQGCMTGSSVRQVV